MDIVKLRPGTIIVPIGESLYKRAVVSTFEDVLKSKPMISKNLENRIWCLFEHQSGHKEYLWINNFDRYKIISELPEWY